MQASDATAGVKVRSAVHGSGRSAFRAYRNLVYGDASLAYVMKAETIAALTGSMPGAAGLLLRSRLYPSLFGAAGRKLLVGRNVTLRHARKIRLGERVILDDGCVIDAKGTTNRGITLGDGVFIGRNTIVYCKNGDIELQERVNVSSSCTLFSSNRLTVERDTMIGAYAYFLSGGEYDIREGAPPFVEQSGMETRGPLVIGAGTWIGARVTVLDAASVGERCVIGAGAVVTKPIPPGSLAVGVPARVVRSL